MNNKTLWLEDVFKVSIKEEPIPKPGPRELRIKSKYSFISQGTERLVAGGQVPGSLHESMAVPGMKGSFSFPLTYGYSLVGEVVDGDPMWIGKMVHVMHPHAGYCVANESAVFEVPADKLIKQAMIGNMETAINAIWDAEVGLGTRLLIVGLGSVGFLCAALAKAILGVDVCVHDINDERLRQAKLLGYETEIDKNTSYDMAIHTSGTASGLQTCIDSVGFEGKVIELSWYGDRAVSVHLGADFHNQRKRIVSSQVSSIPLLKQNSWNFERRKHLASRLSSTIEVPDFEIVTLDSAKLWFENKKTFSSPFVAIDYSIS